MNDIIQIPHHSSLQAASVRQRLGDLIESAEAAAKATHVAHLQTVFVLHDHGTFNHYDAARLGVIGVEGSGRALLKRLQGSTQLLLTCMALPTTSMEVLGVEARRQPENAWTRWSGQAKEALQKAAATERRPTSAAARLRVERLTALQAAFGFTIQDLAAVLGITRPQLYKWLDASNEVKLQEASRARLATVERIAKEWESRSNAPLSAISKEPLSTGASVFAMLSAEAINEADINSGFDELVNKLLEKPKSRSQRLRDAGFTRRSSARSLPSDE